MKNCYLKNRCAIALFAVSLFFGTVSCNDTEDESVLLPGQSQAPDVNITTLTASNKVVYYNARNLNQPTKTLTITGLVASETIVSIDYRPATGQLYGLGSSSRMYFINEESGVATPLGTAVFSPAVNGMASIDFNPTVDRIRLVTDAGQNLRLHPELGTVAATDGVVSNDVSIGAVAYTNSMAGASSTVLYDIDFESDKLYIQNPPNDGMLQEVGALGIDFTGEGDFDISADNSAALAVVDNEMDSRLYSIDLTTGKALWVGMFTQSTIGIAIKTNPVAYATTADNKLQRFNPLNPSSNTVDLMGMNASETIVGLDFRPTNGALYGITNQNRLVTINTASGQVTAVGTGLGSVLAGTAFGFDFNPTVDRIRLVSSTGQNLRLHPDTGVVAATDGMLNPGSPSINGAAYTNNFAGSTATTLFVIDNVTNMLYTQTPPNDGVLVPIGALGVMAESQGGFDIGGSSNSAFGLLKVNNATGVYSVNLATGAATKVSDFNVNATAMAVGLGF